MVSSFLSQNEIEDLIRKLNPDAVPDRDKEKTPDHTESGSTGKNEPVFEAQEMERVEFPELQTDPAEPCRRGIGFFKTVPVQLTLELGSVTMTVREILSLKKGSVIKLNKLAGENATLCVNGKPLTTGEVVVINENFGVRVAEPGERQMSEKERR